MSPSPAAEDRTELLHVSREILEAIRGKNADAIARHPAKDFGAPFGTEALEFESIAVDVFGAAALVSGVQAGQVRLEDGQVVETRSAFTDLFVRSPSGWVLQAATSVDL